MKSDGLTMAQRMGSSTRSWSQVRWVQSTTTDLRVFGRHSSSASRHPGQNRPYQLGHSDVSPRNSEGTRGFAWTAMREMVLRT